MTVRRFLLSLLVFLGVCFVGLSLFVDHEVKKGVDQAVKETPGLSLTYGDIDVSIVDHAVTLTDVNATLPDGRKLSAREVVVTRFDRMNAVPAYVTATAKDMVLPVVPATFGPLAGPLASAGVETVVGDVDVDYDYNAEDQALTVHALALRADDLCDVALSGSVDRLDLHDLRVEELIGLRIVQADLNLVNRSMVDALVGSAARNLGLTLDAARAWVANELAALAEYAGDANNVVAQDAFLGLKRFVNDPGVLDLGVRPAEPVPMLYFFMGRDLYDNLRLLNVTVTTDSDEEI